MKQVDGIRTMEISDSDGSLKIGGKIFFEQTGRDKYNELVKKELEFLKDKNTGFLKEEFAQKRNCPICGGNSEKIIFIKDGFRFIKCGCGLVYVNPIVNEKKLNELYKDAPSNDAWVDVYLSKPQREMDRKSFTRIIKDIGSLSQNDSKRILDVGCSVGLFLEVAKEFGWDGCGVDLNEKAVKYATETAKVNAKLSLLKDAGFEKGRFDAITLLNILEHVPDPVKLIAECKDLLKDKGILFIETPNLNGLAPRLLHEKCSTFGGRNHINYFSKETITNTLEKSGFRIIKFCTVISEIDTIINHVNYEDPYKGEVDEKNPLKMMRSQLAELIYKLDLGYRLNVFAVKI